MNDDDLFTPPKYERIDLNAIDYSKYPKLKEIVDAAVSKRYVELRRSKTHTAKSLGIAKMTLYRILDRCGIM